MPDLDDLDDLFGTGAPAAAAPPTAPPPARTAENRRETRVRVNWPARVLRADGGFQEVRVHDLCEGGAGFVAESGLPPHQVLTFAIAIPDLRGGPGFTPVTVTVKTAHMTIRGLDVHCGGPWVSLPGPARQLIMDWVRRLRK